MPQIATDTLTGLLGTLIEWVSEPFQSEHVVSNFSILGETAIATLTVDFLREDRTSYARACVTYYAGDYAPCRDAIAIARDITGGKFPDGRKCHQMDRGRFAELVDLGIREICAVYLQGQSDELLKGSSIPDLPSISRLANRYVHRAA